jgi:hypothetical protein
MVSKLFIGSKSARLQAHVTQNFKQRLIQEWNFKEFPQMAIRKIDPKNVTKKIPFDSETDFMLTLFRSFFCASKFDKEFWLERNNPDHPEFPEV